MSNFKYMWQERDYFSFFGFAILIVLHAWMAVALVAMLFA